MAQTETSVLYKLHMSTESAETVEIKDLVVNSVDPGLKLDGT